MRFSEIKYERPSLEEAERVFSDLARQLACASSYESAREAFLAFDKLERRIASMRTIAGIRHDMDTRDAYYEEENNWWDDATPVLTQKEVAFKEALLASGFRDQFASEFGELIFIEAEIARKSICDEIILDMQEENKLTSAYEDLLAQALVEFEGEKHTLAQMDAFKKCPDPKRRLAAWKADGGWYKENQGKLDETFDRLVGLRDGMAKKMGYGDFRTLGYLRMRRNCYGEKDIEAFRAHCVRYIVPIVEKMYQKQAVRNNVPYPMSFSECAIEYPDGNPVPLGGAQGILNAAQDFYDSLSKETSAFFNAMLEGEWMDLQARPGKRSGGYCTEIPDFGMPFIFANFNGTQADVEVVTHEAGHAFEAWLNMRRVPMETIFPSMEAAEVHSMAMEFFAEKNSEAFFGKDAAKYRFSHVAQSLAFIPYGTMVDHFQHIVYANPSMTARERHEAWLELEKTYRPWLRMDGEIPFWSEGMSWQFKHHIYSSPFYYIDYCLAQTVSLWLWSLMRKDYGNAWFIYMKYTRMGGSDTFAGLLENAGIPSPFSDEMVRKVALECDAFLAGD